MPKRPGKLKQWKGGAAHKQRGGVKMTEADKALWANAAAAQLLKRQIRAARMAANRSALAAGARQSQQGSSRTVSDGLNQGRVIRNTSAVEMRFPLEGHRREKVTNVLSSSAFSVGQYVLNPGNFVLFPWLANIAANFEQYVFEKLVFSYETEAYVASGSNLSAGKVIMATQYNAANPAFGDDEEMEQYVGSVKGPPFASFRHDVLAGDHALKREPLKAYYVSNGDNVVAPSGQTTQFYELGTFNIATQGNAAANVEIGELYVEYAVRFIRPRQIPSSAAVLLRTAHIVETATGSATATNLFGTSTNGGLTASNGYSTTEVQQNLGLSGSNDVGANVTLATFPSNYISLPSVGRYLLFLAADPSSGSISATFGITRGANVSTLAGAFAGGTLASMGSYTTAVATAMFALSVTVAAPLAVAGVVATIANTVNLSGATGMTGGNMDAWLFQIPDMLGSVPILDIARRHPLVGRGLDAVVAVQNGYEGRVALLEQRLERALKRFGGPDLAVGAASASSSCSALAGGDDDGDTTGEWEDEHGCVTAASRRQFDADQLRDDEEQRIIQRASARPGTPRCKSLGGLKRFVGPKGP